MRIAPSLRKLIRFRENPHRLGLSFGLGIFLGIIPGTGALVAAAAAAALRLNLPLMVAGALLTNPLTTPLVYGTGYLVGGFVLGNLLPEVPWMRLASQTAVGTTVLGVVVGGLGYLLVWALVLLRRSHASGH